MFCPKCGSPNNDGAHFCAKCGAALAATAGPAASPGVDAGTVRGSPAAISRTATGKNPTVALLLAVFLSGIGAGQFYNNDWKKALVIIAIMWIGGVATGGFASLAAWIWAMIDAYQVAKGAWKLW
jgi:TM2 domain-containing membrane protein YozV